MTSYVETETQVLRASSGVDYAYRATGASDATPLVTLQHFRGNLDNWDPALIDAVARSRRVVTFDNRGVAASSGTTPSTIAQMALDAIDFIDALEVGEVDLLGFSIGSFLAQEIALVRPSAVRRVVLASSAPRGASGMHGWAPDVIAAVGKPETSPDGYLSVFFTESDASRTAGQQVAGRVFGARTVDRDAPTSWQTRLAQYDAVCAWGQPNHSQLRRVRRGRRRVPRRRMTTARMVRRLHCRERSGLRRRASRRRALGLAAGPGAAWPSGGPAPSRSVEITHE